MSGLVAQAARLSLCRRDIRDLAAALPDAQQTRQALTQALGDEEDAAFTHLLMAALHAGQPVPADLLADGALLLPFGGAVLAVAAGRCEGDVATALVGAARKARLDWESEAQALILATWWRQTHQPLAANDDIVQRARVLSRFPLDEHAAWTLLGLADQLDDADLWTALHWKGGDLSWSRETVEILVRTATGPVLDPLPEDPPPKVVASTTVRRTQPKVGRNDPCPCGSGRKFKKCCEGKPDAFDNTPIDAQALSIMKPKQLRALDPASLDPALHPLLGDRLAGWDLWASLLAFAEVAAPEVAQAALAQGMSRCAATGDLKTLRRLAEAYPGELWLGPQLALATENQPDPAAALIEAELRAHPDDPVALASVAFDLLDGPYPALGIMLARAALPYASDLDRDPLLERLLVTRDLLGLGPRDLVETTVGSTPTAADQAHQVSLASENRSLRHALEQVVAQLEQARTDATEVQSGPAGPSPQATARVGELEAQLKMVKTQLKVTRDESNQWRRDLRALRDEAAPTDVEPEEHDDGDNEEDAFEVGLQPPRLPRLPADFGETLTALPEAMQRATLDAIGGLAAGRDDAFRGARPLRGKKTVWRQRVGRSYRLLFRLHDGELEIIDLVHRQRLERRLRTL